MIKQFGRNVKAERIRKGLSQRDLSVIMGVNTSYISTIECGNQNMSLRKIIELANVLEVDLKNLLRF